MIIKKTFELRI